MTKIFPSPQIRMCHTNGPPSESLGAAFISNFSRPIARRLIRQQLRIPKKSLTTTTQAHELSGPLPPLLVLSTWAPVFDWRLSCKCPDFMRNFSKCLRSRTPTEQPADCVLLLPGISNRSLGRADPHHLRHRHRLSCHQRWLLLALEFELSVARTGILNFTAAALSICILLFFT